MNKKINPIESMSISSVHFTLNLGLASRPSDDDKGEGGVVLGDWLLGIPAPFGYDRQRNWRRRVRWLASMLLDCGEAAHFAVFQGEVLASPGYCVSGEAPDPDAKGYYVAGGQQPEVS